MVNQEFPFTDRGTKAADKQFTFRLPPEKVSILTEMGVDLVTLANNHILDFGSGGVTDSIKAHGRGGDPPCGGRRKQGPGGAPGDPGGPWKTDRVPGDVPGLYVR